MDLELDGRRVLVTGASRGIGKAIAERFVAEGARVMMCARGLDDLERAAQEIDQDGRVAFRTADLGEFDQIDALVEATVVEFGGIDIVVSNVSGFAGRDLDAAHRVDIAGADRLIRQSLGHMADHDDANVVCIGSRAGSVGVPWMPAYAAAKAATVSLVKSMALEVARRGIRVNTVSPGDIEFPGGTWERARTENPKLFDAVLKENPFRRLGTPEEVADVVAFVASRRATFMTGANVMVDGGASRHLQL